VIDSSVGHLASGLELDGPEVALATVDRLADKLAGWDRAALLRRLGRGQESRAAYDKAIELAGNTAETAAARRAGVALVDPGVAKAARNWHRDSNAVTTMSF
jgi:predicted RNA polymerase sigma factor